MVPIRSHYMRHRSSLVPTALACGLLHHLTGQHATFSSRPRPGSYEAGAVQPGVSRVYGTPAPEQASLHRLANIAGDPLRGVGAPKGCVLDPWLMQAVEEAGAHCAYIPEFVCSLGEMSMLEALALDIAAVGDGLVPHRTQKRLQVFGEELRESEVFTFLVSRMLEAFNLSLVDAWVNVYRDGGETTGWHQDHYNLRTPHASATLNLNLGATRELALNHLRSGETFYIPQENGALFAFDAKFNLAFRHSIPKQRCLPAEPSSLRLSITVFAIEGPQPAFVTRDVENVPPGVKLNVPWADNDFSSSTWKPDSSLTVGAGAARLLTNSWPLLRGHRHGDGRNQMSQNKSKNAEKNDSRRTGIHGRLRRPDPKT
eukprot:TRINITY_DN106682_c0_g1_i1.p1 TRINITY_DN106682_c0_g1~~TRINITY_DN106682_c0_g1_i1.p1  ORF type:complete len:371 (-),score=35.90 TRINITY_DN106682_c0_g1_i1:309-1421(-)